MTLAPLKLEPTSAPMSSSKIQYSRLRAQSVELKVSTSKGDTVEIRAEAYELSRVRLQSQEKEVSGIEKHIHGQKKALLESFLQVMEEKDPQNSLTQVLRQLVQGNTREVVDLDEVEDWGVPEYWNAENTSQRIVDFATSFAPEFGGTLDEFSQKMLAAVKKGFEEAAKLFGELPGKAGELWKETETLTFRKLEDWISAQKAQTAKAPQNA